MTPTSGKYNQEKNLDAIKGKIDSDRKKGGACVRRLLDQWKSSTYALKKYYHKLDKSAVLQENKEQEGAEKDARG